MDRVNEHSHVVNYNKKDIIFRQNTPISHIMFVKSGLVKIFKESRNKKIMILKLTKPGQYIGLISVFGEDIFQYSASAVDNTSITFVDGKVFKDIIRDNGSFALELMHQLSLDGLQIFDKLINLTQKQLPGRIAEIILYFSETIYGNTEFEFPLTRQELAELASTTKESFIRTLSEFKNDKIIELEGRKVIIKSHKIVKVLSELG
jgi:CRP-like cAMP-binding protein